jgi:hypothetical protein
MRRLLCLLISTLIMSFAGFAQANIITYTAILNAANESPPNPSLGTGAATVNIDSVLDTMTLHITFSGLIGSTTASHIHCCTTSPSTGNAGVATTVPTFAGFPTGVQAGTYDAVLDLLLASSYNPSFISANGGTIVSAELALLNGMARGASYLNIHTSAFPGGEIRGFLTPATVPEPSSIALLALGASLLGASGRQRRC